MKLHNISGQPVLVFEKQKLTYCESCQLVPVSLTLSLGTVLKRAWLPLLHFLQPAFIHPGEAPQSLVFCTLSGPSCLRFPKMKDAPVPGPSLCTNTELVTVYPCFSHSGESRTESSTSGLASPVLRRRIYLHQPAGNNSPYAAQKALSKFSKMTHKNLYLHKSRGEGKELNIFSEARATGL